MSWSDREHYPEGYGSGRFRSPLWWLLGGSIPLGHMLGVRVRMHVSMLWLALFALLFGLGEGIAGLATVGLVLSILLVVVLLHEMGHVLAARGVGGATHEVLVWPLGGLIVPELPSRPTPALLTAVAGPAVSAVLCILAGSALWLLHPGEAAVPWNPLRPQGGEPAGGPGSPSFYLWWGFLLSYAILLLNLLPLFPLDGGRILQAALWPALGHHRSMILACNTGLVAAVAVAVLGLGSGNWILLAVALSGFIFCYQQRAMLKAAGADMGEIGDALDLIEPRPTPRRRRMSRRAIKRARRQVMKEQIEQERIDNILAKVSAQGIRRLTWWERRTLRKATERQRQRDLEFTRPWGSYS